jgi:hypothetical protein
MSRKAPRKRQVRIAPIDDLVVVIAVRDRGARQEQKLAKRIGDLSGLRRILDLPKVIEQQAKPGAWLETLTNPPSDPPELPISRVQRISASRGAPQVFEVSTKKHLSDN